jgi:hypothetical protein
MLPESSSSLAAQGKHPIASAVVQQWNIGVARRETADRCAFCLVCAMKWCDYVVLTAHLR